jgi:hypothetical protein
MGEGGLQGPRRGIIIVVIVYWCGERCVGLMR